MPSQSASRRPAAASRTAPPRQLPSIFLAGLHVRLAATIVPQEGAMQAAEAAVRRLDRGDHAGQRPPALAVPQRGVAQGRRHGCREGPAPQIGLDERAGRRCRPIARCASRQQARAIQLRAAAEGGSRSPSILQGRRVAREWARAIASEVRPGSLPSCSLRSRSGGCGPRHHRRYSGMECDRRGRGSEPSSRGHCAARPMRERDLLQCLWSVRSWSTA